MNQISENPYKNAIGSGNLKRLSVLYVKRLCAVHAYVFFSALDEPKWVFNSRCALYDALFQINLIKKYM